MYDPDTFLTTLYVMVDDFCQSPAAPARSRVPGGASASLCPSEVVTLALFSQWHRFASERDFGRWADRHLRAAFPRLPTQSQFNRLVRQHEPWITAFFGYLATTLARPDEVYEALDCTAAPVRNSKRRGRGWLAGLADIGHSSRLGWFCGFRILLAVGPSGVITGFGFSAASTNDHPLATTFFALRQQSQQAPALLPSVGQDRGRPYVADKGLWGPVPQAHWGAEYGAQVVALPRKDARQPGSSAWRKWLSGLRQIVETVNGKLVQLFGLTEDRPKTLGGFQARLAARLALHNFCIWLNRQCGRADLAFADLVDW